MTIDQQNVFNSTLSYFIDRIRDFSLTYCCGVAEISVEYSIKRLGYSTATPELFAKEFIRRYDNKFDPDNDTGVAAIVFTTTTDQYKDIDYITKLGATSIQCGKNPKTKNNIILFVLTIDSLRKLSRKT